MTMPHLTNCPHQGEGHCLDCVKALHDEAGRLRADVASLRDTNRRLNRRAQEAEAAMRQAGELDLSKFVGGNFGRALLAWHLSEKRREIEALKAAHATRIEALKRLYEVGPSRGNAPWRQAWGSGVLDALGVVEGKAT